jgi:hypothetical protein
MRIFEDEALDQRARDEAVEVFRSISEWLPDNVDKLRPVSDFHFDLGAKEGSLFLPIEAAKLVIVFEPGDGEAWVGEEGEWIGIFLPHLRAPNVATGLPRIFTANKITFVHEFMHFLLRRREKPNRVRATNYRRSAVGRPTDSSDPRAYYNHPQETNAYYQEAAMKIADYFRNLHPDDLLSYARKNPSEIVKLLYQFFQQPFLRNLTPENRRKLDKRLARYVTQSLRPAILAKIDR